MKSYNIKLKRTEETERIIDYIMKELNVTNKTALVNLALGELYQKLVKYKSQKYVKNVLASNIKDRKPRKERLAGSTLAKEDQEQLCIQLPNGKVSGDTCEYSTFNEVTGKEYRVKRPLNLLTENFVEEVNTNI